MPAAPLEPPKKPAEARALDRVDEPAIGGPSNKTVRPPAIAWSEIDWNDLVPRLLLLAASRISRMTWRGIRKGAAPGALQPEDVVNDAIAKTIAGMRVWNRASCSLFQHLAGVVVSDVSHAARALENRMTWSPPEALEEDEPAGGANQEAVLLWQAEHRRLITFLEGVDPRLSRMAQLMLDQDLNTTEELAAALVLTPSDVANLRKRLKRAVRAFLREDA